MTSHAEFLRRVTLDSDLISALKEDYTTAPISESERVMLDYVVTLTKDATQILPPDIDRLRSVGFDDQAILQITLIASWFNYINRVADALGVGREFPEAPGSPKQVESTITEARSRFEALSIVAWFDLKHLTLRLPLLPFPRG